MSNLRSRHG
uniref:Uncharacterized protein n=1 Tax=Arundo donax TaxID=35708 RepID=A0A0A9AQU6_ARUDO